MPIIDNSDANILRMMNNVSVNKALGLDGVHDGLFRVDYFKGEVVDSEINRKKMAFCRSLLNP